MKIIGYYRHGNKEYVLFEEAGKYKLTDGFHDRKVTDRNSGKFAGYQRIKKSEINVGRIVGRMRQNRPWHPLMRLLRQEAEP